MSLGGHSKFISEYFIDFLASLHQVLLLLFLHCSYDAPFILLSANLALQPDRVCVCVNRLNYCRTYV